MDDTSKTFAEGFSFKRRENAKDWQIGRLSIKIADAIPFLKMHDKEGWVNLNINYSRGGNYYLELDTFVPKSSGHNSNPQETPPPPPPPPPKRNEQTTNPPQMTDGGEVDDLPF